MTEALGANSGSSRGCWGEESCRVAGEKLHVSSLGQGPEPEELLYLGPETWGHKLQSQHVILKLRQQRADLLIIYFVVFILVQTQVHVLANDELHCSHAHFPESPPENVSGSGSVVTSGNFWPESGHFPLWEVQLN